MDPKYLKIPGLLTIISFISLFFFCDLSFARTEDWNIPGLNFPDGYRLEKKMSTRQEGQYVIHKYTIAYQKPRKAGRTEQSNKWKISSESGAGNTIHVFRLNNLNDLPNITTKLVANKRLVNHFSQYPPQYKYEETTMNPSWRPKNVSSKKFQNEYEACMKIVQNDSISVEKKRKLLKAKQETLGTVVITEIVRNIPVYDSDTNKMTSLDNFVRDSAKKYGVSYDLPIKDDPIGYTIKVINNPSPSNVIEAFGFKKYIRFP